MSEEWYYAQDGQQMGPVSLEEIHRLAVSRMLQPSDLVWTDGMNSWSPAVEVPELASAFPVRNRSRPVPPGPSRRDNRSVKGLSTANDVDFHNDLVAVPNLFERLSAFCRSHPLASILTGIAFVSLFFCCGMPLMLMTGGAVKRQVDVDQIEQRVAAGPDERVKRQAEVDRIEHTLKVTASALFRDYQDNFVAGDLKYKGKVLEVTGTVDSISKDITDTIYVTLEVGGQLQIFSIQCFFDDKYENEAAKLKKGQRIAIRGLCDGKFGNVLIKNCVILKD